MCVDKPYKTPVPKEVLLLYVIEGSPGVKYTFKT